MQRLGRIALALLRCTLKQLLRASQCSPLPMVGRDLLVCEARTTGRMQCLLHRIVGKMIAKVNGSDCFGRLQKVSKAGFESWPSTCRIWSRLLGGYLDSQIVLVRLRLKHGMLQRFKILPRDRQLGQARIRENTSSTVPRSIPRVADEPLVFDCKAYRTN